MDIVAAPIVRSLCEKYGPMLNVPTGIDGVALMEAVADNESSYGSNCKPRYEHSYDVGGRNDENEQTNLIERFGRMAACSYGPWQIMPCNALDFTPAELYNDPDSCAKAFVAFFNSRVIRHCGAKSVAEVGQVYNGGHISAQPNSDVMAYMAKLTRNYFTRLNEEKLQA